MKKNFYKNFLILELLEESSDSLFYSNDYVSNIENLTETQYNHDFRMDRECFRKLKNFFKSNYLISNYSLKMHMYLYYIGHDFSIREIGDKFGIPKSTCSEYINEILEYLYLLSHKNILFPNEDEYEELCNGFQNFGNCWGTILAIDGTHFLINKPLNNTFDYYNRKGTFSINFICVVDYKKRFRGMTYGYGKSHDAGIYSMSNLKRLVDEIGNNYFIVGDPAFRGFNNILSAYDSDINSRLLENAKRQRIIIENAFGLFKNKFKKFSQRTLIYDIKKFIKLIKGAMFLHNYIIDNN